MGRVKTRTAISNDKEERIRRAIAERAAERTALPELALKYGVPRTTLGDRLQGGRSMREAKAEEQSLNPYQEKALVKWVAQMESTGFPPRLDLFKAIAAHLAKQRAEDEGDPKLAKLGCSWLRGFLNRHPEIAAKYAVSLDIPRELAGQPGPIRRYFELLGRLFKKYRFKRENIYNMDEKGFMLGMGNRAKVITHRTTKPPKETQDGSREWITVVEPCAADNTMLAPIVIYQGQAIYRGWYDVDVKMDRRTAFARSDKGFTNDELALDWLRDYFNPWTKDRANGEPRLPSSMATAPTRAWTLYVTLATTTSSWFLTPATLHICYSRWTLSCFPRCRKHTAPLLLTTPAQAAVESPRRTSGSPTCWQCRRHTRRKISSPHGESPGFFPSTPKLSSNPCCRSRSQP
jgi:hypothetical protein